MEMEYEKNPFAKKPLASPADPQTGRLNAAESIRSKTSTRIFYEAQVAVIKKQLGGLEEIREKLGLSQRKMSQLLMVDPSAWTRWNRDNEEAPPHIWRALQWYMALNEKLPGLTPQYFVGKDPQILHEKALRLLEEEKSLRAGFQTDLEVVKRAQVDVQVSLSRDLHFHRRLSYFFALTTMALIIYLFIRS